ncbi:putative cysteine desulfurase [Nocardia farcinica]|uniref:aminotransferase class V-fold PLP-dependent enzyme n=1 Tax=Nocardia farcinica TaxID=37329 RepID=UPI000BF8370E|nr:aminotransferase class V-fold PLP-dependent enzyme [Nocardia farcinica]PFX04813.1 putative cysteine desulfurase [Nocardia farcinica]PFX09596.1 putative cysteine desulfurase [Nocardia farcinica]
MRTSTPGSPTSTRPSNASPVDASFASVPALFPALADPAHTYLDSAATTQKPVPVIDTVTRYHRERTANAGRGSYPWSTALAGRITETRARTAAFLGAGHTDEIVFTPGATAALNAVALCWGLAVLDDGDEILYSPADHASNVLPWHHLRGLLGRAGRRIDLVPYATTRRGTADIDDILARASPRTRLVTVAHLHHVYGGRTDVAALRAGLDRRVALCVDASQSAGHLPLDVTALGADFTVLAAHKMFGAPGLGVLYCGRRVHDSLLPFLPGGNSGVRVGDSGLESTGMPHLLEGGTPDIPAVLALGSALDVLESLGRDRIAAHNHLLTRRLIDGLRTVPGLDFLPGPAHGPETDGDGIVSFTLDGIAAADLGFVLAEHGFLVRTGSHCVPAAHRAAPHRDSVRVSTHVYTTVEQIDRFVRCVATIAEEVT